MDVFKILGTGIRFNKDESNASKKPKTVSAPVITDQLDPALDFFNDRKEISGTTESPKKTDETNCKKCLNWFL